MTNQEINAQRVSTYCTHFDLEDELACKCKKKGVAYCDGHPDTININLLKYLEIIRENFGGLPMTVSSCLRCPTHNTNSNGKSTSRHLTGLACDFMISGVSTADIIAFCKTLPLYQYAYAIDGNYVHLGVYYQATVEDDTSVNVAAAFSEDAVQIKISDYGDNFVPICTAIGAMGIVCHTATLADGYFITAAVSSVNQITIRELCDVYCANCEAYVAPVTEESDAGEDADNENAALQARVDELELIIDTIHNMTE